MSPSRERAQVILVVEDVEETRQGIARLLSTDGYRVSTASNEDEAVLQSRFQSPDLILISLNLDSALLVAIARRIRERSGVSEEIPVVVFCLPTLEEGSEVDAGYNVHLTRPDNFNELRAIISRLLRRMPRTG